MGLILKCHMYMEPMNNRKLKISCTDRTSRIFRSLQTVSEKIFGHNQSGSHGFQVQLVTGCDISVFFTNLRYISPIAHESMDYFLEVFNTNWYICNMFSLFNACKWTCVEHKGFGVRSIVDLEIRATSHASQEP